MKKCPYCVEEIQDEARKCKHCGSILSEPDTGLDEMDRAVTAVGLAPELKLGERYRLVRELGRGGMGVVWLAKDERLDLDVAVKVLPPELARDSRALRDLANEAKLSMQLSHPNIVRLHNLMESDHLVYLVMEYVEGSTLEKLLVEKGKLSVEETLNYSEQLCAGLQYAHDHKVIHRDLKPANLMLAADGTIKIADFGIARQIKDSLSRVSKSDTSGTLLYMSPEQLMGETLDYRSDIYSLGCVFYELLSGAPPFTTGNIPTQIQFKAPAPLQGIPAEINQVVLRMLAKKSDERPESALRCSRDLRGKRGALADEQDLEPQPEKLESEEVKSYRKAAEHGDAVAQFNLGVCYYHGKGVTQNVAEAVKWLRKAADHGSGHAQNYLGWCYLSGKGVPKDDAEAVKWYRKAADQEHAQAQEMLATCYYCGIGVTLDNAEAVKWYRKAAEHGDAEGQFNLGMLCYLDGTGVTRDEAEAFKWCRKAAEQGYVPAQCSVGWFYANGKGLIQDKAEAVKWYRKAAEQGDAEAQYGLGECYYEGEGVTQDKVEAVKLFRKAAEQGNADAEKALKRLL